MSEFSQLANRSQGARAVGGRLSVHEGALRFEPNVFDAATGGKPWSASLDAIQGFEAEPASWTLGNLFSGGLRMRLAVVTDQGRELFVVRNVNTAIEELTALLP